MVEFMLQRLLRLFIVSVELPQQTFRQIIIFPMQFSLPMCLIRKHVNIIECDVLQDLIPFLVLFLPFLAGKFFQFFWKFVLEFAEAGGNVAGTGVTDA